jgi:dihydropteroate synthase
MDNINVKCSMGVIEFTPEQLTELVEDYQFLLDAFLIVANEKEATKSDLPYNKKEVMKMAKAIYKKSNYCQDFINRIFKKKQKKEKQK